MSEHLPTHEHKEPQFYGKTWDEWHEFCMELDDPSSATTVYGDTAEQRAWWSVAAMSIVIPQVSKAVGHEGVNAESLGRLVSGYVSSGNRDIGERVIESLSLVPTEVAAQLVAPRGGDA